ncbi:TRAF3-interacting protein 1 [Musca vetustissima]|uniref:TRAF3-interacting protein 1 n=1 Tax=Musca vetustissima TaxID=27455 RepID=UPI002AB762ED|nr:TRAF3-interacting protein 1 [Musca vetustissima]
MSEDINPAVIKHTQETLGKYVKKPHLTEKLLRKPPFRFLHDVFTVVIRDTGCFEGLYTADELNSDNIKDREDKMRFLQKMIDVVRICTNVPLTVKTSKIVAGHEAEKTNELLQLMGKIIENKLNWQPAVEQVLKGKDPKSSEKPKEKSKDKESSKTKDATKGSKVSSKTSKQATVAKEEKPKRSKEKEKTSSTTKEKTSSKTKEKEKIPTKSKESASKKLNKTDSQNSNKTASPIGEVKTKKKEETSKVVNEAPQCSHEEEEKMKEDEVKPTEVIRKNSLMGDAVNVDHLSAETKALESLDAKPDKDPPELKPSRTSSGKSSGGKSRKAKKENKEMSPAKEDLQKLPSPNNENTDENNRQVSGKLRQLEVENVANGNAVERKKSSSRSRNKIPNSENSFEISKETNNAEQFSATLKDPMAESQQEIQTPKKQSSAKIRREEPMEPKKQPTPPSPVRPQETNPEPLPVAIAAGLVNPPADPVIKRESTFIRENSKDSTTTKTNRPRTSLRPPSARPPSARPGAPRRRDRNIEIILQPNDQIKMSGIQVKLENFGDLDDDGENLVIIENPDAINSGELSGTDSALKSDLDIADATVEQQGHLVQQILETQKELTQQKDFNQQIKNEKDTVNGMVMKQTSMNNLRDVIQNLTKSINPLGKLMDFIPEDIDAMQLEFTMWRDTYTQAANQLKREKSLTESATEPMKNQLLQIESSIQEYMEMIDASRVKILQNNEKIFKMLTHS